MTLDKSLKRRSGLVRSRNVLTRDERIKKLLDADRWAEGNSPFGLPKVRVYKLTVKKKKKPKEEEAAAATTPAPAEAPKAAKPPAK